MNSLNMKWLRAPATFIAIFLGGCATTQTIPESSQPQSAVVGIELALQIPEGTCCTLPEQVYFVNLDPKDGFPEPNFISSNFSKDGRVYLLNAEPGTYAAVVAVFLQDLPFIQKVVYATFFSKELVERIKSTVKENDFVFLGSYKVEMSMWSGFFAGRKGDEVQNEYRQRFKRETAIRDFTLKITSDRLFPGTMLEGKSDEKVRNDFIRNAKVDLAGSAWVARIK